MIGHQKGTSNECPGGLHTKMYLQGIMSPASFTQGIITDRNVAEEPASIQNQNEGKEVN